MILSAWLFFGLLILGLLLLDLGVFHKKAHVVTLKEAVGWSIFWIALGLIFNVCIFFLYEYQWFSLGTIEGWPKSGHQAALQYLTGYLVEKALSIDNIFVIALVFIHFRIPQIYQHRILFWGIIGALVFRGLMIALGASLIHRFEWITYVFGAFLILVAVKLLLMRRHVVDPEKGLIYRWFKRTIPLADHCGGGKFWIVENGRRVVTLSGLALVVVESSDIVFAVDSIPAILAITRDPFLVFTSNVFAVLGLRSLYFVLTGYLDRLRFFKMGLVVLLGFIGLKMLLTHIYKFPPLVSLSIIGSILGLSALASILSPVRSVHQPPPTLEEDLEELAQIGFRQAKRLVILVFGSTLVLIGALLLVLPGPGIITIIAGLWILAMEFSWARRWLKEVRDRWDRISSDIKTRFHKP